MERQEEKERAYFRVSDVISITDVILLTRHSRRKIFDAAHP